MPTPKNDALIAEQFWYYLQTSITDVHERPFAARLPERHQSWCPSEFEDKKFKTLDPFEAIKISNEN